MIAGAAAVAVALGAAAVAAQPVDDLTRAMELRKAGRAAEAAPLLEDAAKAHPQDADVWLNLGLAYAATGRLAAAERALDEAQRLAPDYADVQLARARVAYFRGDLAEAERRLQPVLTGADRADALELKAQLAQARAVAPFRWRADAFVSGADLSRGLPSQRSAGLSVSRSFTKGRFVIGSVEHRRQFGINDTYWEAQAGGPAGYLAFGGAPHADFRPKWALRGGVFTPARNLGGGWSLQGDLEGAWSRYPVGTVRALNPALAMFRGDALRLTARWINVVDERDQHLQGYALQGLWRPAPRLQLGAGWADAPESSEGVTQQVRAASLSAAVDVDKRTTLRLDGVREMRPGYRRHELAFAATRRF